MSEHITAAQYRAMRADSKPAPKVPYHSEQREAAIVADIRQALARLGYLEAHVGQYKARGSGTTTGYPDMSVRHPAWTQGCAILLEVKTERGHLSREQSELHAQGWSIVVRSVPDALAAVLSVEKNKARRRRLASVLEQLGANPRVEVEVSAA